MSVICSCIKCGFEYSVDGWNTPCPRCEAIKARYPELIEYLDACIEKAREDERERAWEASRGGRFMKPIDETWDTYITGPDGLTLFVKGDAGDAQDVGIIHDGERAKLAAQAPDMARRLLRWVAACRCGPTPCLDCEGDRAVLRAAGVLPSEDELKTLQTRGVK